MGISVRGTVGWGTWSMGLSVGGRAGWGIDSGSIVWKGEEVGHLAPRDLV